MCATEHYCCKDGDAACGSSFPVPCNLVHDVLYSCSEAGANPEPGTACAGDCIVEANGPDHCVPPVYDCPCEDDTAACGGTFSTSCNIDSGVLYTQVQVQPQFSNQTAPSVVSTLLVVLMSAQNQLIIVPARTVMQFAEQTFRHPAASHPTLYTCTGATPEPGTTCAHGCVRIPFRFAVYLHRGRIAIGGFQLHSWMFSKHRR